ncbi:MAG: succinic semialdehyde dehydrogenase [Chloroflexota bacterium]|nr:succinic semialdehyde dehydrogenase [Chloroflexota bacterium]
MAASDPPTFILPAFSPLTGSTDAPSIAVLNPVTGTHVGTVPDSDAESVRSAVASARAAQPAWADIGTRGRARLLRAWANEMWNGRDALIALIRAETGKNESSAYSEIAIIDNIVAYYAAHAPRFLRPRRRKTLLPLVYGAEVDYLPYGVVGAITPWNYPYFNLLVDVIPALIAGNAVVIKPSELTPLTALHAVERMRAVGIPADVIQVVTGRGDSGRALLDYADTIAFTGSTAVGRSIAVRCAERLIPCTLELGGKDAMIVLDDADLDHAARAAVRGGLENAGQACVGIERIYVENGAYEAFVEKLRALVESMHISSEGGFGVEMGSLTAARELHRVEAQVADAVARGAQVLAGGTRLPDLGATFYAPTLLTQVDHTMQVMRDETFGPVLPVMRVRDADEAVRLANDSPYGLSGAVFSRDEGKARRVARRLRTGDVSINGTQLFFTAAGATMGGFKQSGIGRRGGVEGLLRFVQAQSVLVDRVPIPNLDLIQANALTRRAYDLIRRLRL